MHSPNLIDSNIEKIKQLFPDCVTESMDEKGELKYAVDFDQLRQELSDHIVEGAQERYQLNWPGKRYALLTANAPIAKTLRPDREESVNFDITQNLFIEGDNLEALKLLQETYLGKVKVIYIDPPYNTGNDFIYEDDFAESTDEFLVRSNQRDDEGNHLVANKDTNGRFHSDWLSMMLARLKLARNLLKNDGAILISIDDGEAANLRKICNEIFGESNFVADLIWSNKEGGGSSDSQHFRIKHEHILCYAKNINDLYIKGTPVSNESRYTQSDEYVETRGPYYLQKLGMGSIQYSSSLDYKIDVPDGMSVYPKDNNKGRKACWRWSLNKYKWGLENGYIEIKKDTSDIWTVYTKQYLNADNEGNIIERTQRPFGVIDTYSSTQASKYLEKLGIGKAFNYSKPTELVSYLIDRVIHDDEIVFDFFSGSGTTADSVMQINAKEGSNHKFIMVQLPEKTDVKSEAYIAGYSNIAEISKERIRRSGKKIINGECHHNWNKDVGFRVLKIDTSNMADVYYTPDAFDQHDLPGFVDNIKPERDSPEDLLFQVLLDWGVDLSLPIRQETIQDKTILFVDDNALIACFDTGITEELVKELAGFSPLRVVFRDNGFISDAVKINVDQIFKQLSPGTEVKSI